MNRLQLRPCSMLGWAYCDGNCENCKTTASTTFTPYDPIEVARQYAPKFDKPVVDVMEKSIAEPYIEFCEWVAEEIFGDEGNYWENVKDAFPELACRRLHKLGIVHKEGDKWLWVDRKELEDG